MFPARLVLSFSILLLAGCTATPPPQPAAKAPPPWLIQRPAADPRIDSSGSILVYVPDLSRVEPMPIFVPDSMIDRGMVWKGPTFPMRHKAYVTPKGDSAIVLPR